MRIDLTLEANGLLDIARELLCVCVCLCTVSLLGLMKKLGRPSTEHGAGPLDNDEQDERDAMLQDASSHLSQSRRVHTLSMRLVRRADVCDSAGAR